MDRRTFVGAVGGVGLIALLPSEVVVISSADRINWAPGSLDSSHASLVKDWVDNKISEGVLYVRDDMFGSSIKLIDPRFEIATGKPIFNWMTGYTSEDGLAINISELGVPICETSIGTSIGYEEYWDQPDRDMALYPDYFVRKAWLTYDDKVRIEEQLPKGHVGLDMRWLEGASAKSTRIA